MTERPPLIVRDRQASDLDRLVAIAAAVQANDGYPGKRPRDMGAFLAATDALGAWVAELDGDLVGHVALHRTSLPVVMERGRQAVGAASDDELAVVARLIVDPGARRRGVGRVLLDRACRAARAMGRHPILDVVTRYAAANALYRDAGWTNAGQVEMRFRDGTVLESYVYTAPDRYRTEGPVSQFSSVDASADPSTLIAALDRHAAGLAAMKAYVAAAARRAVGRGVVLDLGCGAGHDLERLDAAGLTAVGVDPSAVMLEECRARIGPVPLARADGSHLPFRPGSIDGCRMERVLMHVDDPAAVLADVARVLRPGGFLAVFEPDWAAYTVESDLPDAELVHRHFGLGRHRDVGGYLPALFDGAGIDVLDVVTEHSFAYRLRDLPSPVQAALRRADADPGVPAGLPAAWLEEQTRRDSDGTLRATWKKILVVGTRR